MIEYENIVNNLMFEAKINNENQLSQKLDMSRQSLQNHKQRNTLPYKQIITFCILNKIDINKIFNNNVNNTFTVQDNKLDGLNIIGNNNNISNHDNENKLIEKITKLPQKRQDYYYHIISAELLELDN